MDLQQLIDYLVPVLFIAVWVVAKMFGLKEDSDDYVPPSDAEKGDWDDPYEEILGPYVPVEEESHEPPVVPPELSTETLKESSVRMARYIDKLAEERKRLAAIPEVAKTGVPSTGKSAEGHARKRRRVLKLLEGPQSIQDAYLFHEVIGSPVGLRERNKMGPSWE